MQCWTTYADYAFAACHYDQALSKAGLNADKISVLALKNLQARLSEVA
jgi:hypothetical protein